MPKNKTAKTANKQDHHETVIIELRISVPAKDLNSVNDKVALLKDVQDWAVKGLSDWGIAVEVHNTVIHMKRELYLL